jgi:hypothetical protein
VTLVLGELSGPKFGGDVDGILEFRGTVDAREVSKHSIPLEMLFSRTGAITVPFLIHGTGCESLLLEIRLSGVPSEPDEIIRTVPFRCGE